ncbi:MAG: hypothetical protein HY204_04490 [Nitrospirae bacterium]|nr:hypothetical protein [Nitrospirota bacterium]
MPVKVIANAVKKRHNFPMETFDAHSSGRLRIGSVLFLAFIGTGIYLGFQLAPYWINNFELQELMTEKARGGQVTTDAEMRKTLTKKAEELGITLADEDIEIERNPTQISISTRWQFDYNFFGLYTHTFVFSPQITAQYQ